MARKFYLSNWNDKVVVGVSVIALFLLFLLGYVVYTFIGTFILSLFVYYSTRPIYRFIDGYSPSRTLSASTAVVTFVLPVVFLLSYTLLIGIQELDQAIDSVDLTEFSSVDELIGFSEELTGPNDIIDEELIDIFNILVGSLPNYVSLVVTVLIHLLLMISVTFYLLRDDHLLFTYFKKSSPQVFTKYMKEVDKSLHSVFFGNILNVGITAIIAAVIFNGLDFIAPTGMSIPYPTLLAMLCGIGSLVPIVGMKVVYYPIAGYFAGLSLLTPLDGMWFVILFFLLSAILVDGIPDIVLRPYVSGDVHTGMLMVAYIIGPLLFGWYGLFLGPFLLVLLIEFMNVLYPFLVETQAEPVSNSSDSVTTGEENESVDEMTDVTDVVGENTDESDDKGVNIENNNEEEEMNDGEETQEKNNEETLSENEVSEDDEMGVNNQEIDETAREDSDNDK